MLEKGRRGVLGVPLIGPENPVGVLWVHWKNPHRITDQEERLLLALAGQVAVALENVRLFDQLKMENVQSAEESHALQEIGISLTEPIDLNEVLHRVLVAAVDLANGDEDTILFYDESRDEFDATALVCKGPDQPLELEDAQVRQRTGLAYQIVHGRRPEWIHGAAV